MNNKEKWVDLFEKVIGRKPTPEEFVKGKKTDFDFKQIKHIAGISKDDTLVDEGAKKIEQQLLEQKHTEISQSQLPESQLIDNQVDKLESPLSQPTPEIMTTAIKKPKRVLSPKEKRKRVGIIIIGLLLTVLIGLFFYFRSITGKEVAGKEFIKAVEANDYAKIATIFSSGKEKWSDEEAKQFISYLRDEKIDIETVVKHISESKNDHDYKDSNYNRLFGFEESGRKFGIFQEYQVTPYPIEISVKTNMKNLKVNNDSIKENEETVLGKFKFIPTELVMEGETDLGKLTSNLSVDLSKVEYNQLLLSLETKMVMLQASLPKEADSYKELKLFVNKKEVANSLTKELELLNNQTIEVYATFKIDDNQYKTKILKKTVPEEDIVIDLPLVFDDESIKQLEDSVKAKAAKEEEAKKAEEDKRNIGYFLEDYREAVFDSIDNRTNTYAKYYDTNSTVYKEMVEFTEGGGVAKAQISYYIEGALDVKSVSKEGDTYIVNTYEEFTSVYTNNNPNKVFRKNKTYYLKKTGESFIISNLEVSDLS
ncbi:TcaA second domain-containing protein [Streptococcus marimammalium]|uniref:TcaA second domain-containing protein n=1 Tax=Streptococcus marimammalium TaxID=269666 RepID=UPI00037832E1|nr:hypothetical protein [Streptococcus marimammalium]